MKHLKHILLAVAVLFLTLVTVGCSNKGVKGIECNAAITARRNKITVVADFIDSEKRIFNTINPSVAIYNIKDGKTEETAVDSKTLSIKTGTTPNTQTSSNELVFSGLDDKNKDYTVKVLVTVDGYESVIFEKNVTMSDEGSDSDHPILIKTVDEFLAIKNDREGYFKLENDLDFENRDLSPMFYLSSSGFTGEFNGNGKTIKNFNLISNQRYSGLFGYNEGNIINLTIDNMTLTNKYGNESHIGFIAGYSEGDIKNCKVMNSKLIANPNVFSITNPYVVGGLVGTLSGNKEGIELIDSTIENCTIEATVNNNNFIGGAIGNVEPATSGRAKQNISNNKVVNVVLNVTQKVQANVNSSLTNCIGGFAGQICGNVKDNFAKANISVNTKSADIYASIVDNDHKEPKVHNYNVYVGGFAGRDNPRGAKNLVNVAFSGNIEVTSSLPYTAEEGKEKHLNFNLYVAPLLGFNYGTQFNCALAKDVNVKVTTTKENIFGTHNVFVGKLFNYEGEFSQTVLTDNSVQLFADFNPVITNNDFTLTNSTINNVNNNLDKFSDFIKNNL